MFNLSYSLNNQKESIKRAIKENLNNGAYSKADIIKFKEYIKGKGLKNDK